MGKLRPCLVCGKSTSKSLYKDKKLDFAICSGKCEHQFVLECDPHQQLKMLRCLDRQIKAAERSEKIGWATAGVGVILVLPSFLLANAYLFVLAALLMGVGASSTRIFEEKREKLAKKRKRIEI